MTAVYSAYSRDPIVKKTYVQDLLLQNINEVCDDIMTRKGHFYICGDVRMAAGVTNAFESGLIKCYNMTQEQAKEYINKMKVCRMNFSSNLSKIFKESEFIVSILFFIRRIHDSTRIYLAIVC